MRKLLGRRRHPPGEIVVVSGLPRSGTSLMMKMLEAGGLEPMTDGIREADPDNPRGYYELELVKKLSSGQTEWLADATGRVVKVIAMLLYHLPDDYSYKVVFMHRPMPEILRSQRRMLENRDEDPDAVPDEEMARLYRGHLDRLRVFLAERKSVEVFDVDYPGLVNDGGTAMVTRINEFLGGRLDAEAMKAVIDPDLYRQRAGS